MALSLSLVAVLAHTATAGFNCSGGLPVDCIPNTVWNRHISTTSTTAQQFFVQSIVLSFAFNHDEAARSIERALEADPQCCMCYFAAGYARSPNINRGLSAANLAAGQQAMAAAVKQGCGTTHLPSTAVTSLVALERQLVNSMIVRFPPERTVHNGKYYEAKYQAAIASIAAGAGAADTDVQALHGQALMEQTAWHYFGDDGALNQLGQQAAAAFNQTLQRNPTHPLALHLGIHLYEASTADALLDAAAGFAATLGATIPQNLGAGVGHLVHMPGHALQRVGEYSAAAAANVAAIEDARTTLTRVNFQLQATTGNSTSATSTRFL
jgi:tetratricopeptide (TPR) repeat protein